MNDMDTILDILKSSDTKNFNILKDILARGIKLEPFQANLMFLNRGYGETHMSMILLATKILEHTKDGNTYTITIKDITDKDCVGEERTHQYIQAFKSFMHTYYPEIEVIKSLVYSTSYRRKIKDDK